MSAGGDDRIDVILSAAVRFEPHARQLVPFDNWEIDGLEERDHHLFQVERANGGGCSTRIDDGLSSRIHVRLASCSLRQYARISLNRTYLTVEGGGINSSAQSPRGGSWSSGCHVSRAHAEMHDEDREPDRCSSDQDRNHLIEAPLSVCETLGRCRASGSSTRLSSVRRSREFQRSRPRRCQ